MKSGRIPSQTTTTTCSALPAPNAARERNPLRRTASMTAHMGRAVFKSFRRGSNEKVKEISRQRRRWRVGPVGVRKFGVLIYVAGWQLNLKGGSLSSKKPKDRSDRGMP